MTELPCGCVQHPVSEEAQRRMGLPGAYVLEVDLDCPQHGPPTEALLNRQEDPWNEPE